MSLIPRSHADLLERPLLAALTTRMPDTSLQTQPVWFDADRSWIRLNTMRGFRKEQNMRADPRVSLFIYDPDVSGRWIEVRGLIELDQTDALAHLDQLARRYAGTGRYFGECVPSVFAETERPVIARLTPTRVAVDTVAGLEWSRHVDTGVSYGLACIAPVATVPHDHIDLLERSLPVVLATATPTGWPRSQPGWCDFDASHVRVGNAQDRLTREAGERATVLVIDPADRTRWIEVRGKGEAPDRIHPMRIVCDAIHHGALTGIAR